MEGGGQFPLGLYVIVWRTSKEYFVNISLRAFILILLGGDDPLKLWYNIATERKTAVSLIRGFLIRRSVTQRDRVSLPRKLARTIYL